MTKPKLYTVRYTLANGKSFTDGKSSKLDAHVRLDLFEECLRKRKPIFFYGEFDMPEQYARKRLSLWQRLLLRFGKQLHYSYRRGKERCVNPSVFVSAEVCEAK